MKITIMSPNKNWCTKQLIGSAQKNNINVNIIDFKSIFDIESFSDWGDVVILRNTVLKKILERPFILNGIKKRNSYILNRILLEDPLMILKSFQQEKIKNYSLLTNDFDLTSISTYKPKSKKNLLDIIKKGYLKFPFVEKQDLGAKGIGVRKIKKFTDIKSVEDNIYQNFIDNNGDHRVLCLGGNVLGIVKRTSKGNSFRNNVSQGGVVEVVKDEVVYNKLSKIALKIASVFSLDFCGVDIIYDTINNKYLFLEVNSYPWWEGFQNETGIEVSEKIIEHCKAMYDRNDKNNNYNLIKKFYKDNFSYLQESQFHFASRMYFWFGDKNSEKILKKQEDKYIGISEDDIEESIKKLLIPKNFRELELNEIDLRLPYLEKYKMLYSYNLVLFRVLFCDKIYKKDIRPIVKKYIESEDMIKMKNDIEKNDKSIPILSTYALNFFYNLENYLKEKNVNKLFIDSEKYYQIAKNGYKGILNEKYNLRIYFLTHCIIGESRFYCRRVKRSRNTYIKMIKLAEEIISENYFNINLDLKLEFLVCARILNYKTKLKEVIYSETKNSLSNSGNYLIDVHNSMSFMKNKNDFKSSEHRNILYLMAFGDNNKKKISMNEL